jgi:hypothetical protein
VAREGEEEVASTGEACCGDDDGAQWWRWDGSGQAVATGLRAPRGGVNR